MNSRFARQPRGFTLIEMVIVFALIGILVGLGLPQYKYSLVRSESTRLNSSHT